MDEKAELQDLLHIQLRRQQLEAWWQEPFFEDAVRGCLVRYAHGEYTDERGQRHPNYLMMKIVEVVEKTLYK